MTGEKREVRSEKEYRKVPMLSASDLRSFSIDRQKFFKTKVLGEGLEEDVYNESMLIGSVTHCLLLEPENFEKKYMMSICSSPPTANLLLFTESLYRHTLANMDESGALTCDFNELVDLAYPDSEYKIAKEAVLKKFVEPNKRTGETAQQYYDQLIQAKSQGLEVCCVDDINIAEKITKLTLEDEFAGNIFVDGEDEQSFNEQQIEGFYIDGLEMKAMLDKIKVNHKGKFLTIYDLKVVYDVVNFRREYFLKKQAYIQAYVYYEALRSGKLDLGFDYSGYIIDEPKFVVVHSGCFYKPLVYNMSFSKIKEAYQGFMEGEREYKGVKEIIQDILWCQENALWSISKNSYEKKGLIEL